MQVTWCPTGTIEVARRPTRRMDTCSEAKGETRNMEEGRKHKCLHCVYGQPAKLSESKEPLQPFYKVWGVQKANYLWMDDKALEVKNANLGKEKANDKAVKGPVRTQTKSPNVQGGVGRSEVKPFADQRSYAEVITGQRSGGENITLKVEEIGNGCCIEDIMVRESGGRDVVITFKSKKDMGLKLKPIKELILD
ncbi:hypothetical protein ACSBR2_035603 [Camellia fascicularis]